MTILHNHIDDDAGDYNESNRVVLLHQHAGGYDPASFTTAKFDVHEATISKMRTSGKPKTLKLTVVEADAFVAAWTQFKADLEAAKAAKVAQQETDLEAAMTLAKEMKEHLGDLGTLEIHVDRKNEQPVYSVSLPALGWKYYAANGTGYRISNGTALLKAVKEALEQIASHIGTLKGTSEYQREHSWDREARERNERWIAVWDAAQAWVEEVEATYFKGEAQEATQSDYNEAVF